MAAPSPAGDTPFRLNLEQQKKRAKELLKALRAGDAQAWQRLQHQHTKFSHAPIDAAPQVKLSDAQHVIARELGSPSWPKLRAHIQSMHDMQHAIVSGAAPPDADMHTLHIRCGSDLQGCLPAAGFVGDFLEYSDPVCQGPVFASMSVDTRADFLFRSYAPWMDLTRDTIRDNMQRQQQGLANASGYERIVLWFEHDSYDQLTLARLLAYFELRDEAARLEMVSVRAFPGSARFIGLGQLPPEAVRLLWPRRQPVTREQLEAGRRVWHALCEPSPQALTGLRQSPAIAALLNMAGALLRHLQELPSQFNGLGLTEQLTLEILSEGAPTPGRAFAKLMREKDPLPWLGDVMYWHILQDMADAQQPALLIGEEGDGLAWHQRSLSLTDSGRALLAGTLDWRDCRPPPRWLGGVQLHDESMTDWRWAHIDQTLLRR